eukprot:244845-Chlamydomonas_euryale.AAC.2
MSLQGSRTRVPQNCSNASMPQQGSHKQHAVATLSHTPPQFCQLSLMAPQFCQLSLMPPRFC